MTVYKKLALAIVLVVIGLVLALTAPATAEYSQNNDSAKVPEEINGHPVPKEIGNLPVVFVETPENDVWLDKVKDKTGKRMITLVVLDKKHDNLQASINFVDKYLASHPLPEGWSIATVGGPDASVERILKEHKEYNKYCRKHGLYRNEPGRPAKSASSSSSTTQSYAFDANNDPETEGITYQFVKWDAPQVGNNQDAYSVLTLNGETDTNYFLQSGNYYANGEGHVAWADTGTECYFRDFTNVNYYPGNRYSFLVELSVISHTWWYVGSKNEDTGNYENIVRQGATGSKLIYSVNTSVFFENYNTNENWYEGFTNPISAFYARDSEDPNQGTKYWGADRQGIFYQNEPVHPDSNDIITGNLADGDTAYWHLEKIWLAK